MLYYNCFLKTDNLGDKKEGIENFREGIKIKDLGEEECPSGRRGATGNRMHGVIPRAAGSNPASSAFVIYNL